MSDVNVETLRKLAADPTISMAMAAERMGLHKRTVSKTVKALGIPWAHKPRGPQPKELDMGQVRRLAADPNVSLKQAGIAMGVAYTRVRDAAKAAGIKWEYSRTYGRGEKPPAARPKLPAGAPHYTIAPKKLGTMRGYSWHCPALRASGWCRADTPEEAHAKIAPPLIRSQQVDLDDKYAYLRED